MAIILEAAYSKKLGLPGFSSHSYVVSVRTELNDMSQVAEESSRLYQMLQTAVDNEIQAVGFIPDPQKYGFYSDQNGHGNGHSSNESGQPNANGNGHSRNGSTNGTCNGVPISPKQLDLVNNIVRDKNLTKNTVEEIAVQMFGVGVSKLNKMQASNLIDELFETYGKNGNGRHQPREKARA